MRRTAALLSTVLLLPALAVVTGGTAAEARGPAPKPAVKKVERTYGGAQVRLDPGQGVDITFRAKRGDRVMLDLRSRTSRVSPCSGTQVLTDGRGRRAVRVHGRGSARIMRVRTSGRVVLGFRGGCAYVGQRREPSRALLTKVRMREVTPDSRTRVRAVRRGFRDVAWVRVAAEGRDTLTIRNTSGHTESFNSSQMLVGDAVADEGSTSWVSVEAGRPYALPYSGGPSGSPLRRGQRVGIVVKSSGYAESLRAREHSVSLEGPALTLPAQPGREHVLLYRAMGEDLAYVVPQGLLNAGPDLDDPTWWPWLTYADDSGRDDPNLHRTVVMSDPDGAGPQSVQVRVRRTVRVNDLVVDGPPVTFASSEPGTRFVAVIPASAAGTVRLTATDVATTGPWQTYVPPVVCYRDCYYPGLSVGAGTLAVDGGLWAVKPHELQFAFAADATGSVTLQLTDVP